MKVTILLLALLTLGVSAFGQYPDEDSTMMMYDSMPVVPQYPIPFVRIDDRNATFQASLYPDYYRTHSAYRDIRWVRNNDSTFLAFWREQKDSILTILSQLSGIPWVETVVDLYLVRYYPSTGGSDPLVFPLGGVRKGTLSQAVPEGSKMQLNVIYQMAHRMLAQTERSDDPFLRSAADHPLMRPGAYRRDNLALLLALVTAQHVLGLDSTYDAYQSAFWKQQTPGREVFEKYMLSEWILTEERPLAQWVIEEPPGSQLVRMTRAPRPQQEATPTRKRQYIEGLPLKGQLGFSVRTSDRGQLVIDQIDVGRLAYASGLREGDVMRSVDGARIRSQKDMIEKIIAGLDQGGATVEIRREDVSLSLLIQPLELYYDDEFFWDVYEEEDVAPPPSIDSAGGLAPDGP